MKRKTSIEKINDQKRKSMTRIKNMPGSKKPIEEMSTLSLFERVATILDQAQTQTVRAVNTTMVTAYWLIGREIVLELQKGTRRAAYGKQLIEELSEQLTNRFGRGYSSTNLWYFRQFYLVYEHRPIILHPAGGELENSKKVHPSGGELDLSFDVQLSWSHYRAIMKVTNPEARAFYENEACQCGWSKTQLERQIATSYYERIIANNGKKGLVAANRERLQGDKIKPTDMLKSPMILEFLDLPDSTYLHESELEAAIISNLQSFLL